MVPRSLCWILRLDGDSAFSQAASNLLQNMIKKAKVEVDVYFYKLRRLERDLRSRIHDPILWFDLHSVTLAHAHHQASNKRGHFRSLLSQLCDSSPWSRFSSTTNVVNLSKSFKPSHDQKVLLGLGLNFALPHTSGNFTDYLKTMFSFPDYSVQHNFLLMHLNSVFDCLKQQESILPKRFRIALQQLRLDKTIRISKADKGGKVVISDVADYNLK